MGRPQCFRLGETARLIVILESTYFDIMSKKSSLNNPRGLYPTPPFPDQPQPAPGLARKMNSTPDHGEQSYRGSGKLTGRKALITGGDSGIGRAAAIAYLPDEEADAEEVIRLVEEEGGKAIGLPRAAGRTGTSFCLACLAGSQLYQWRSLWRDRR